MKEATETAEIKPALKAKPDPIAGARARFREARLRANFTLKTVAEAAGVSIQAISQFEQGKSGLQLASFVSACDTMLLRTEWVLKGTGETFDGQIVAGVNRRKRKVNRRPATRSPQDSPQQ